jgi:hypothetical protein
MTPTESQEQIAIFEWAAWAVNVAAEVSLLYAIPNGGLRTARTAGRLRKEGVKKGVPDLCLPIPRGSFHGLYIELKRTKGGETSPEQRAWLEALAGQGYKAVICKGADKAIEEITNYLDGEINGEINGRRGFKAIRGRCGN